MKVKSGRIKSDEKIPLLYEYCIQRTVSLDYQRTINN